MDGGQPLEREAVLAAITTLVNEVRAGRGGTLFVVGEAGLGKTTSLSQVRVLAAPAVRVGLGRGDVMETSLPFGVLAAALGAVGNHDLVASPPGAGFGDARAPVSMRCCAGWSASPVRCCWPWMTCIGLIRT
ncbi:MAG: ATP-binding protein, partial [Pseudonocardiaceae bacterium]